MWSHLRKQKEKLYSNKKVFRSSEKNWNIMNLNKVISFDIETIKFLCNNFKRRSFLDMLDDYRCEKHYMKNWKKCRFDNRIENLEEIIMFVSKKQSHNHPSKIQNIHFLSIHEKEEMLYHEKTENY
jgi:hypothetical protein